MRSDTSCSFGSFRHSLNSPDFDRESGGVTFVQIAMRAEPCGDLPHAKSNRGAAAPRKI
jgi:hypothetical protein